MDSKNWLRAVAAAALITTVTLTVVALKGSVEDVRLVLFGLASFIENLAVLWIGYRLALAGRPTPKVPTKDQVRTRLSAFFEEGTGREIKVERPSQWEDDPLKDPGDVDDAQIARERTGDGE